MRVLVVGGAGYVGSHVARRLSAAGMEVAVLDNLSTGHRALLERRPLLQVDLLDAPALENALWESEPEAVVHLAAKSLVAESMEDPGLYYANNLAGTLNLLQAMRKAGVRQLLFSSTAAVYGEPQEVPIREEHPLQPTNVYGETKRAVESMLAAFGRAYGMACLSLRYFNAAGAEAEGQFGEDHRPETHLIPRVLRALREGTGITIYGQDYPTPDGTALRDYIHVEDLAEAHFQGLRALERGITGAINLGSGRAYSVREVVETAMEVTGRTTPVEVGPRRSGDPAALLASGERAREVLGFVPSRTLRDMLETAWRFHQRYPQGYVD